MVFLIFKGQYKDQQLLFKIKTIFKSYHKLQELLAAITLNISTRHRKILDKNGAMSVKNRQMYLSKKILHHYFVIFLLCLGQLSKKKLYVIT